MFEFLKNIFAPVANLIDELHTSGEEKAAAKAKILELQAQLTEKAMAAETQFAELQSRVIVAEASGSYWQRNWRPHLMYSFIFILVNNFILFPYISMFTDKIKVLEFPTAFWGLLTVGLGGYLAGRTFEKVRGVDGGSNGNGG